MKIGNDTIGASTYETKMKKKQIYFEQLLEIARAVIDIKDEQEFIKNPTRYIIDQSKIATGLKQVKEEEFLKLVDLPLAQINLVFERYNSFNVNLFEPAPSFEYHTTSKEQETEYKELLKLCDQLNAYKRPLPLQLQYQFNGDIVLIDNSWQPNAAKIMLI
jgi:hypothetical protein